MSYNTIEVQPLTSCIGAEIAGVDLSRELTDEQFGEVKDALVHNHVIFFRDQEVTPERQLTFAKRFGTPEVHPIVEGSNAHPELIEVLKPAGEGASFGTGWHTDNTFFEKPTLYTMLYGIDIPPVGGDTLWADMAAAYDALSDKMKELLDGLVAVHSASIAYDPRTTREKYEGKHSLKYKYSDVVETEVEHPLIRTHDISGRKCIYVNPMFTLRIKGMTKEESAPLLKFLYEFSTKPEFVCRFRWQPKSVAMWDNSCTQHYAMNDYVQYRRFMRRVTIGGDTRPV
ncbi:MAG: taurine dioxygenase [Alphaproteobacteria bacterium]|nr:MAG: taurine dioxygenase [Alphaproteobacteria bacterium]